MDASTTSLKTLTFRLLPFLILYHLSRTNASPLGYVEVIRDQSDG
jgi:hypothetical protein